MTEIKEYFYKLVHLLYTKDQNCFESNIYPTVRLFCNTTQDIRSDTNENVTAEGKSHG